MERFDTFNQLYRTNDTFRMLKVGKRKKNKCVEPDDITILTNIKGSEANESSLNHGSIEMIEKV